MLFLGAMTRASKTCWAAWTCRKRPTKCACPINTRAGDLPAAGPCGMSGGCRTLRFDGAVVDSDVVDEAGPEGAGRQAVAAEGQAVSGRG